MAGGDPPAVSVLVRILAGHLLPLDSGSARSRVRRVRGSGMGLFRDHNFLISVDGFGTGEGKTLEEPFGHAGERLHEWLVATPFFREMQGQPSGLGGVDDVFARQHQPGIGAEIMGALKFGYPGWHEDPEWKGWW